MYVVIYTKDKKMIDQIKNKAINAGLNDAKKALADTNNKKVKVQKVNDSTKSKIDAYDGKVSQFISREKIKDMAKEPPIDEATTSRIKKAIQEGKYPLDMTKLSDALFDAYKEVKD